MTGIIGLRYERLLMLSAPLTFAALVVLFIAFASDSQKDRVEARCYSSAVDILNLNQAKLNDVFNEKEIKSHYQYEIKILWIRGLDVGSECYSLMDNQPESLYQSKPADLISKFRNEAEQKNSTPISFYGVELPDVAKVEILGTSIKIQILTFTQLLQMTLAPLLILWLGSLYNTRFRESLQISKAADITDVFGHSVNLYPSFRLIGPRKRSWVLKNQAAIIACMFLCGRIFILCLFITPPIIAYLFSFYFLYSEQFFWFYWPIGIVVSIFWLSNLMLETMPWHYMKRFPSLVD